MEQKAEATRLVSDDRVAYLVTPDTNITWVHATFGRNRTQVGVITWTDTPESLGAITLTLNKSPFHFHENIGPAEARLLASALLMAADDVEKAIDAAHAKQMAEDDEVPA